MPQPKRADSRYLREVAYADPSGFEARAQAVGHRQEELVDELADAITARIRREGQFTITTEVAFLTATKA